MYSDPPNHFTMDLIPKKYLKATKAPEKTFLTSAAVREFMLRARG